MGANKPRNRMSYPKTISVVIVLVVFGYVLSMIYSEKFPYDYDLVSTDDVEIEDNYPSSPQGVVNKYLEIDSKGAYLSDKGKKLLRQLNSRNLYIQQELKIISIISGYAISNVIVKDSRAKVIVVYNLLGEVEDYFDYKSKMEREKLLIELEKNNERWEIVSRIFPHISVETYLDYLNKIDRREEAELFLEEIRTPRKINGQKQKGHR